MTPPTYARLEKIRFPADLRQETDQNLELVQRRYKIRFDQRVRFITIFHVGAYVVLGGPSLFCSSAQQSDVERYSKSLPRRDGPYKVITINKNTTQVLQDGLKAVIHIH